MVGLLVALQICQKSHHELCIVGLKLPNPCHYHYYKHLNDKNQKTADDLVIFPVFLLAEIDPFIKLSVLLQVTQHDG